MKFVTVEQGPPVISGPRLGASFLPQARLQTRVPGAIAGFLDVIKYSLLL